MAPPRLAITGIGLLTPLGLDRESTWQGLCAGHSGIRTIAGFDHADLPVHIGGELPDGFTAAEQAAVTPRMRRQTSRSMRAAILVAREAVVEADLTHAGYAGERIGVFTGSSGDQIHRPPPAEEEGMDFILLREMANAASAWIAMEHGFGGPAFQIATACASGAFAVAQAIDYIRGGRGDAAVALGVDLMLTRRSLTGFSALMALSTAGGDPAAVSRPFDRERSGFVLSDGAGALVIEREDRARARGVPIHALLLGHAETTEAFSIIKPRPEGAGMARTLTAALADAEASPDSIGYVNAHGTSTDQNDLCETLAIRRVFGAHAERLMVSSQKSMIGHTIGGAGAIEAAVTAMTLSRQVVTPTRNFVSGDAPCTLDYVPGTAREVRGLHRAVSDSFGFGGHNCTLVLERA